jgi:uncharacterized repeat protein (TIGR01451 family)
MISRQFKYLILAMLIAPSLSPLFFSQAQEGDQTPAGSIIHAQGYGLYKDDDGRELRSVSELITTIIRTVALLSVTPNETEPSARILRHQEFVRLFEVCHGGNNAEQVVISKIEVSSPARVISLHFDTDDGGTLTAADQEIIVGGTLSPILEPGNCTGVLVRVNSESFPVRTNLLIRLTARSAALDTANGRQEATGQIVNAAGDEPRITGLDGLAPRLLVNGLPQTVATANETLTYSIALLNSGDSAVPGALYLDNLPAGLESVPGSLKLDGKPLNNSQAAHERTVSRTVSHSLIEVGIPSLAPGQSTRIEYQVRVQENVAPGRGLVSYGIISAQNFASIKTTETVVIIDPFGVVFAARSGSDTPVPGANVTLLTDTSSNIRVSLPPGLGFPPNAENANPNVADSQGRYNFTLAQQQLGSAQTAATYYLHVAAPGFMSRTLSVSLSATHSGLFQATFAALDGQALAEANGFRLVRDVVMMDDLASLSANIPMFEIHSLGIDKAADKQRAEIGDVVTYTINVHNPTSVTISNLVLRDSLPKSFHYAEGTARMQKGGSNLTATGLLPFQARPTIVNDDLVLHLGEIAPAGQTQIQYRVRIGANARAGNQFNQAVVAGRFPNGDLVETDAARVSVYVGAGIFSMRQIILGRVYEDVNVNRRFDKDDQPIAGARVYLMNGQYVLTDSAGLYNFPTVGDGAVVIALDPISVSPGLSLWDGEQVSGRSWSRLLRTPLGGGSLLHQDFGLTRTAKVSATASAAPPASFRKTAQPGLAQTSARIANPTSTVEGRDQLLSAGTYNMASGGKITPVKPGEALILSPAANSVLESSGSQVQVRVALDWKVLLEINDKPISDNNIGETRVDRGNQITTYTFAGLNLPPGPNRIRVTPLGPNDQRGAPVEIKAMGRGAVARLNILTERNELVSGGKDSIIATIRALDQWGSPAQDGLLSIEATNIQLMTVDGASQPTTAAATQAYSNLPSLDRNGRDFERQPLANPDQVNELRSRLGIALKDGEARIKLVAPGLPMSARVKAMMLNAVGELDVRIVAETRPTLLVGLAEASFGNVPGSEAGEDAARYRSRLAFFFRGTIREKNVLTLSYDSLRPLNRTAGQDRLFQLDPLERAYPVFGDSSTRFEEAQSNSKLYARLDRGRSYALFGDFDADMSGLALAGYSRKLTGVKLHLEDRAGSFITLTGARPSTAFARDVIPAGALSLVRLTYGEILPGSETVTLEVRDRRNPEIILSRELLIRSVDYNLDAITGQILFLRFISTFDYSLNLTQIVVTYEHRAGGLNSIALTGRALKKFPGLGLQLGLSGISQRQAQSSDFRLGGIDAQQRLSHGGVITAAAVWSRGGIAGPRMDAAVSGQGVEQHGFAYDLDYNQPVSFREGVLHAKLAGASAGFLNPFGATVTPGSRRAELSFSFKLRPSSTAKLGFISERNHTEQVDNSRSTLSLTWTEAIRDNLRLGFGYDSRKFSDHKSDRDVTSNLFTIGAEWRATKKLELTAKREQNLGSSDPTYPNQTTLGANYRLNDWAKLFFTQRIASAPIVPISDTTGNGFSASSTHSEMAFGIETKLSRFTSMTGRYQLDRGANTTDSFAVIGLVHRLPVNKQLSLELGYERGLHLKGQGANFNSVTLGAAWQPKENFVGNFRYELRDRNGMEHLFVVSAAGRINDSITALSRFQMARLNSGTQQTAGLEGEAALAFRPAASDRMGLLFSYSRRSRETTGSDTTATTRDRAETLSTDAFYQLTPQLELSARLAARFNANGQGNAPYVATLTYLTQGRMQYRFAKRYDLAAELRALIQTSSWTAKKSFAAELGYWALPELRVGAGYNFTSATEPFGSSAGGTRRGFYFNISTKLSRLFDLFGTSDKRPRTTSEARGQSELKGEPK